VSVQETRATELLSQTGVERSLPSVSLIIPTRNRPEQLRSCLEACARLEYPRHLLEFLLVDDGSSPPVSQLLEALPGGVRARILRQNLSGPAAARNRGIEEAAGELLVFLDDDCLPVPDWLLRFADAYRKRPSAAFGGRTVNRLPNCLCSATSQLLIDYLYQYFGRQAPGRGFFASNNLAAPREALRALGGFDIAFPLAAGEDRELCDRWLRAGFALQYVAEAVVRHGHWISFRGFCRQHVRYGRGAFHFQRSRRRRGLAIRIEPVRFYRDLVLYPFRQSSGLRALRQSMLLAVSQVCNAAGFALEAGRAWRRGRQPDRPGGEDPK